MPVRRFVLSFVGSLSLEVRRFWRPGGALAKGSGVLRLLALVALASSVVACASQAVFSAHGVGPATSCASDLLDHGYVSDSHKHPTRIAEELCAAFTPDQIARGKALVDAKYILQFDVAARAVKELTPAQLDCAKREFDAKRAKNPRFRLSDDCREVSLRVATNADGGAAPAVPPTGSGARDIIAVLTASGKFTKLLHAFDVAGLTESLKGPGPFAVFAPTDEAFAKWHEGQYDALLSAKRLKSVLLFHIVQSTFSTSAVEKPGLLRDQGPLTRLKTLNGLSLNINWEKDALHVGPAVITNPDVAASNGVIEMIDTVLGP